jgi:hypothetical protein
MKAETKHVDGKLLSKSTGEVIGTGQVSISVSWSDSVGDRPSPSATMEVVGFRPELDQKYYVLELAGCGSGEVFVSIGGIPDQDHTRLKVQFSTPPWTTLEWFAALPKSGHVPRPRVG